MKRKLVRVGNSLAVTLPHDLVKDGVKWFDGGEVSPRYRTMADRLVEERRELYERLARG